MSDKIKKDVNLVGRDFGDIRKNLIDFTKNYFPQTYNDFNESSPGMMFMEMASYVGDVLSYYTDVQLRESVLEEAQEKSNVFTIAQSFGYKPKLNVPATTILTVYQIIPAMGSGDNVKPNFDYALTLKEGMTVGSTENSDVEFSTLNKVRFNYSSSFDTTDVSVYQIDETTSEPVYYLLKKYVRAVSGKDKTADFEFESPKPYDKIKLEADGLIDVIKITDDDGDEWTKVDYLAQDTVFEELPNTTDYSLAMSAYANETPSLLKLKRVPKRYITRVTDEGALDIQFGAGVSSNSDEEILPNPDNVGSALYPASGDLDQGIDPSNFMYAKTYGVAPSNTKLTVTYRVGTGVTDNIPSADLTTIIERVIETDSRQLVDSVYNVIKNSVAVTNEAAATGAQFEEEIEQVRNNALAYFRAQNRAVTKEDYLLRAYALPPQFGSVAKAYAAPDFQINTLLDDGSDPIPNPLAINFYTLGYDSNKKLTQLNVATKQNLQNYISYYRILTDAVNIKNAYIVNIGINFEIIVLPNYNSNEVLLKCINSLKSFFAVERMGINKPINLTDIYVLLDEVDGVQSVVRPDKDNLGGLQIVNKFGGNYSPNKYNTKEATRAGIVYPPKDPTCFEVKYPDTDIIGRVVSLF
tara:strand:+ start:612 stop:2522 length:1911 start_codon:yes stop_codon:yes gene_type:complete